MNAEEFDDRDAVERLLLAALFWRPLAAVDALPAMVRPDWFAGKEHRVYAAAILRQRDMERAAKCPPQDINTLDSILLDAGAFALTDAARVLLSDPMCLGIMASDELRRTQPPQWQTAYAYLRAQAATEGRDTQS